MKMVFTIFLILALMIAPVSSEDRSKPGPPPVPDEETQGAGENGFLAPVYGYQKHLSPVLGGKCPMHPSCSRYCVDAVKKHGPVLGWIMTCDRLMRCGRDEVDESRSLRINGSLLCEDPVANNDFWLKQTPR
jgi:putative membrane protein insertion efficiency factor